MVLNQMPIIAFDIVESTTVCIVHRPALGHHLQTEMAADSAIGGTATELPMV
jgi:hypothetical protein